MADDPADDMADDGPRLDGAAAGGSLRVLVADDSRTRRLRLAGVLRAGGCDVCTAEDGADALALVPEWQPDVVLSDVLMPRLDGFELCRSLRGQTSTAEVPVVLISSAFVTDEDRSLAYQAGADAYVTADLEPPALLALLRETARMQAAPLRLAPEQFARRHGASMRTLLIDKIHELEVANAQLETLYESTLEALVAALDVRDSDTELHSWRVSHYAVTLGRFVGMDADELRCLRRGALLHDVGKIGVPDALLRKPGPLSDEEWTVMREHPRLGADLLRRTGFLESEATLVLAHHERWDGSGYPHGLAGEAIPLGARLFAVADTLDVIVSGRPYAPPRSVGEALAELDRVAGAQLDPDLVGLAVDLGAERWHDLRAEAADERQAAMTGAGSHG
jgi:putative two-component system response regulator